MLDPGSLGGWLLARVEDSPAKEGHLHPLAAWRKPGMKLGHGIG